VRPGLFSAQRQFVGELEFGHPMILRSNPLQHTAGYRRHDAGDVCVAVGISAVETGR
jgi:hypothetical protein